MTVFTHRAGLKCDLELTIAQSWGTKSYSVVKGYNTIKSSVHLLQYS